MIHVENLVKTFGDTSAVGGITFDARAGEIFAFLGPNGAGKTTTVQMLTTLLRPTSGSITIDGLDPAVQPLDVRRRFGIVFQDPSLDHELTAFENIDLHGVLYHVPRRARVERIQSLLLCGVVAGGTLVTRRRHRLVGSRAELWCCGGRDAIDERTTASTTPPAAMREPNLWSRPWSTKVFNEKREMKKPAATSC